MINFGISSISGLGVNPLGLYSSMDKSYDTTSIVSVNQI